MISKLFQIIKMIGIIIGTVIGLVILIGLIFINFSPEFGEAPSAKKKIEFTKTDHYQDAVFVNQIPTSMDMSFPQILSVMKDFIKGIPNSEPDFDIPVLPVDSMDLVGTKFNTELVWFGHSAFYLQMDGQHILIDPMLGNTPSPHPLLGKGRYSKTLPISIDKLPQIDAIIISHDHYDHLDYGSIMKLKDKTKMFYVPLGVAAHFESWGISADRIVEMDWWNESAIGDINLVFAPARHFSGRGLTDRNSTLWGSWILQGTQQIYFSGDGGYGPHFKEIGDKYGPFDLAMIECGQYNEKWSQIHMMPEESAQAGIDVRAKEIMPIHWGAFSLSLHPWTDPVERILAKSKELNLKVITPKIGEIIRIDSTAPAYDTMWWMQQ